MVSKLLTVRIPEDLHQALLELMQQTGLDKTAIVRKLLRTGLEVGIEPEGLSTIPNRTTTRITNLNLQALVDDRITQHLLDLERRLSGRMTEQLGECNA